VTVPNPEARVFAAFIGLGIALVLFGAVVLLRYSDRPGGTVKWFGLELTSAGAGLPLIALGIGCAMFAFVGPVQQPTPRVVHQQGATTDAGHSAASVAASVGADDTTDCLRLAALGPDRVDTVEAGMRDVQLLGPHQPLDRPFGVVFTDGGRRVGAIRLRLYRASDSSADLYKIEAVVDAACRPVERLRNTSRGGDPRELVNWDTVRLHFGDHDYDLRVGGNGDVQAGHFTRVP
jgi:hypothetical protein